MPDFGPSSRKSRYLEPGGLSESPCKVTAVETSSTYNWRVLLAVVARRRKATTVETRLADAVIEVFAGVEGMVGEVIKGKWRDGGAAVVFRDVEITEWRDWAIHGVCFG